MSEGPEVYAADAAASTDVGVRRSENQDVVVLDHWASGALSAELQVDGIMLDRVVAFAVVDGMGGHQGGSYASWLTARALIAGLDCVASETEANALAAGAHETVSDAGAGLGAADMGAAFAALVLGPDGIAVCNVGDCRVYRVVEGMLGLLTVDDTGPSRSDPSRTVLTQAVGGGGEVAFDAHWMRMPWIARRHRFLLASDGLLVVPDAEAARLAASGSPSASAAALVAAALAAGAPDNVSVIVVDAGPVPGR